LAAGTAGADGENSEISKSLENSTETQGSLDGRVLSRKQMRRLKRKQPRIERRLISR
jgi:hypothetical protein